MVFEMCSCRFLLYFRLKWQTFSWTLCGERLFFHVNNVDILFVLKLVLSKSWNFITGFRGNIIMFYSTSSLLSLLYIILLFFCNIQWSIILYKNRIAFLISVFSLQFKTKKIDIKYVNFMHAYFLNINYFYFCCK